MKTLIFNILLIVAFTISGCSFPKNNEAQIEEATESIPYEGDGTAESRNSGSLQTNFDFVECDFTGIEPFYAEMITKIAKRHIKKTIKEVYKIDSDSHCFYDEESKLNLSCYSMETKASWISDFDNDGEKDILFRFIDEGCGGGGNMYYYEYLIAIIKDKKLKNILSFYGGSQFSNAALAVDTVINGRIRATYTENQNNNMDLPDDTELRKARLFLIIENGKIAEESYKNCPVAIMDKRIFSDNSTCRIERSTSINDMFEEESNEMLYFTDSSYFHATLSGCENINLSFTREIPYEDDLGTNKKYIKKVLAKNITLLIENSRYESTLTKLLNKLKVLKDYEISIDNSKYVNIEVKLDNNWYSKLIISNNNDSNSMITINLIKMDLGKELGFWENFEKRNCKVFKTKNEN